MCDAVCRCTAVAQSSHVADDKLLVLAVGRGAELVAKDRVVDHGDEVRAPVLYEEVAGAEVAVRGVAQSPILVSDADDLSVLRMAEECARHGLFCIV